MIMREWRGVTATDRAQEYAEYVRRTGLDEYGTTPGNRGSQLLLRDLGDGRTEIVTLSWWDSLDVIRGFAGDDISVAHYYPEDDEFLLVRDENVNHYEVHTA